MEGDNLRRKLLESKFNNPKSIAKYARDADKGMWVSEDILTKEFFPRYGRILDIGCGCGRTTIPLSQKGYEVVGIDISRGMIEGAIKAARNSKQADLGLLVADACTLCFSDNSFDGILFSYNGLSEVYGQHSKEGILREISRVLKEGGVFIFTAPYMLKREFPQHAFNYLCNKLIHQRSEAVFGDIFEERSGKLVYFNIPVSRVLNRMLRNAGFEIILCEKREKISQVDNDDLESFECNFYVCKKSV